MKLLPSDMKRFMIDIFFPNRCPFCGQVIMWNIDFCDACYSEIPWTDDDLCRGCGNNTASCCCKDKKLYFIRCYAAMYYIGNAVNAVISLKQYKDRVYADIVAERIACEIDNDGYSGFADCIVPVPMGKRKKRKRGYNQADILGLSLSEKLDIPLCTEAIIRMDSLAQQHSLSGSMREKYVKGKYFAGNADINGKNIILCDDVMTTGSTMNECSRVLMECGAASVIAVCAATTIK